MVQTTESLINIFSSGYLTTNQAGKILSANKYLLELLGVKEQEFIGQTFLQDLFQPSTKTYLETHVMPLLHLQNKIEDVSVELVLQSGKYHPILLSAVLERDADGEVKTIYYNFFDASQPKKHELELLLAAERQSNLLVLLQENITQTQKDNAYYKLIIENHSFYIVKTDLQGDYTYMNPYFCSILGIQAEDWLGKNSLALVIPEDHSLCIETVEKCFANPESIHRVILRKESATGRISTQWDFRLLRDDKLNLSEVLCIGHDITPLIKKQEELQNLVDITAGQNKRLLDFTYIVSHNIRSHVANLSGIISVIDMNDEDDRNFSLGILKKSVNALDDTIHNLNEIISIQANVNLPKVKLNLHNEIEKVLEIIHITIVVANVAIQLNFSKDEQLFTNPAYLESIVLNLLTNSIKYKSPDRIPQIDISIAKQDNYTVLNIRDNGLGINLDRYRDRLFGMYNTFHGNKDAQGLGLFIIKTQIEAMRGKIEVESEVNVGTTFKVFFPDKD